MISRSKLTAFGLTAIMVLAAFAVLTTAVVAEPRATGETKPSWDVNTYWEYRYDNTDLEAYSSFLVNYQDTQSAGGPYTVETEMTHTPTQDATQRKITCTQVNVGALEYKTSLSVQGWENGTWATVVSDTGGSPAVTVGQTLDQGTYKYTVTGTGEAYYNMNNLNFKRATSSFTAKYDATGDIAWTFDINDDSTESTSNGDDAGYKPTWKDSPMIVGDTWKQENQYTQGITEDYAWGGDFSGSGTTTVTTIFNYKYTWSVASKASKTIANTKKGSTTFPDGYKLQRTGSFDWDQTVNGNQRTGTQSTGTYESWYAGDGDNFDAGWTIDFNGTTRMIYSNYVAFINTAPAFTSPPPADVTINEDELWEFKNGVDYAVSDPDTLGNGPDGSGDLAYKITKVLGTKTNVLSGMTIDADTGDISYTPTQADVADAYEITINVTDKYTKGALGVDATFTLNIKNKNDPPTVNSAIMVDFDMQEGEKKTPTWKLSDAFKDPDMELNPLMGNAQYDANEKIIYSVANNGSIRVLCPNNNDLSTSNQCDAVSFQAIDVKFPRDQPVAMTFTGTDKGGQKVTDQLTITVKHVNHLPKAKDGKDKVDYEMDEDTTANIELKNYFVDADVYDPNYVTTDGLTFDSEDGEFVEAPVTGTKAKLQPKANQNGEDKVLFYATDKASAKATIEMTVDVIPVNDAPTISSFSPTSDPTIEETDSGQENGNAGKQKFGVVAADVDKTTGQDQTLTYNWTVEDDSGNVYKVEDIHTAEYTLQANFDCDFENGKFCGGDSSKTYYVTATVSDGVVTVEAKKWYLTIKNVNRAPIVSGIEVFLVDKTGAATPVLEKTPGNYSIKYGKVIRFDVTNKVTDLDEAIQNGQGTENIDKLSFEWSSSISSSFGSAAKVDVGAGKKTSTAPIPLKAGKKHIITVRVTDNEQASDSYAITVSVGKQPSTPGFEGILMVAAVGVAVAVVSYRYRK